jgi:hypothetical protein
VEDIGLSEGFQLPSNQRAGILHDIVCSDCVN